LEATENRPVWSDPVYEKKSFHSYFYSYFVSFSDVDIS
jgi:hypothetical protein